MIREVIRTEVLYGHFVDAVEICREIEARADARKLPHARFFFPIAGRGNVLVSETDFESLAEYEKVDAAYMSDPEIMKNLRRLASVCVQGSMTTELLGELPEHIV
jgi:hypothetical protein